MYRLIFIIGPVKNFIDASSTCNSLYNLHFMQIVVCVCAKCVKSARCRHHHFKAHQFQCRFCLSFRSFRFVYAICSRCDIVTHNKPKIQCIGKFSKKFHIPIRLKCKFIHYNRMTAHISLYYVNREVNNMITEH